MCNGVEVVEIIRSTMHHKSIMRAWKLVVGPLSNSVKGLEVRGNQFGTSQFGESTFSKSFVKVKQLPKEERISS